VAALSVRAAPAPLSAVDLLDWHPHIRRELDPRRGNLFPKIDQGRGELQSQWGSADLGSGRFNPRVGDGLLDPIDDA
jgi:hypothetical protein